MLRESWRAIRRMPVVSAVIVLSLAAGIGVNTVVFSWIQSRVLEPLPGVEQGARFHGIEAKNASGMYPSSSWPEYEDLRDGLGAFEGVIASRMLPLYVGERGQVERAYALLVSPNYFEALRVTPLAGRFFSEAEAASRAPVAVISYGLWQSRFGGRADIVGQRLRANGADLQVTGVTPRAFQGTVTGLSFDIWVPATLAPLVAPGSQELDRRTQRGYSVLGRLPDGVSRGQAQAEVSAFMTQLATSYPDSNTGISAEVLPFWQAPRGPNRMITTALMALQIVMLLLLLAVCGNTANLVLARASARQKEIGVRLALGSGPWRVARLLLVENMMLGVLGAIGGAAIAVWGTNALKVLPLTGLPIRFETSVDLGGLAFAIALGVLCGMLVGAIPALHLARLDPLAAFRAGAMSASRNRTRNVLMAAQVALALVVLIAGGLFLRSFLATRTEDTGFTRHGVLLVAYDLTGRNVDTAGARTFAARLLDRLRAHPDVAAAAVSISVPLDIHGLPMRVFTLDGRTRTAEGQDQALTNVVTPGYFEALDIPIRDGRDFAALTDTVSPPQAVVNETFVRAFIGEGSAIGRRLQARGGTYMIAGVVADSLYNAFGEPPTPIIYFSYRDRAPASGEIHLRARSGDGAALAPVARAIVRDLDADLPVFNARTFDQHVDTNLVFRRVPARMFAFLGPLLLVLAAIGIYAVVAYSMSVRRTEIGVRIALGASAARVVRDFVSETMGVVMIGAAMGWLVAFVIAADVTGGAPLDLIVFAGVPALLLTVAALASWLPAQRAAKLEPWQALR